MNNTNLLKLLRLKKIKFDEVLTLIDQEYDFIPSSFRNGVKLNNSEENQGSARVLYYAKLNNLSKEDTLLLFAEHYSHVLDSPNGVDHQNIREFLLNGWEGVFFANVLLKKKD